VGKKKEGEEEKNIRSAYQFQEEEKGGKMSYASVLHPKGGRKKRKKKPNLAVFIKQRKKDRDAWEWILIDNLVGRKGGRRKGKKARISSPVRKGKKGRGGKDQPPFSLNHERSKGGKRGHSYHRQKRKGDGEHNRVHISLSPGG